jgi:spermidine synthase
MTLQAGMTKLGELDFFTSIHRTLREVFPVVAGYQTFMSCFGTAWGFITATKKVDPMAQDAAAVDRLIADRISRPKGATPPSGSPGGTALTYWDGQTHQHAFHLPKHIRAALAAQTRVVTDANPLIVT